jgi:methionine sulfoxide reductase heme-binding subunit
MDGSLWWYTARAGGLVAWGLLATSVLLGLLLSTKILGGRPRPAWLLDLHRYLGGAAVVFTAIHVATIVADSYVHFGLAEILVPFIGSWHPVAVGWGIVATYLLVAVELTSLLRARLPLRLWRATHYLSFPLFALASVHSLTAGTDRHALLFRLVIPSGMALIAGISVVRIDRGGGEPAPAAVRSP